MDRATPEAVMAAYAELINQHDFELLTSLIDDDATFWFSSGSYHGMESVRAAFERTWQRLSDERYWLEDVRWIAKADAAASCIYSFHWQAVIEGQLAQGSGRGTTVLGKRRGVWRIAHEHLSAFPE
ncbi:nuclear transport factor 2 family protein [Devosia neptuniae]|uniref:Nuclear transport factor 2 family protein n=1 Tax=Devosia neptuniae TaxID=191302 RepID=A0ABY6CEW6_9HYPH|nr:nuclear transport factor 2 family protein [Devosia neptuniae]UXN69536.1 nuclear transport factor 2 family protein [Devosia neptuniae]